MLRHACEIPSSVRYRRFAGLVEGSGMQSMPVFSFARLRYSFVALVQQEILIG
jgi:hypothetical protein